MNTKNVLRKAGYLGLSATFALALQSCGEDDPIVIPGCNDSTALNYVADSDGSVACTYAEGEVITENITTNTTWTHDKVYVLGGRIAVEAGATLTIEAGTVIKGEYGTGANATALVIARGAKLMANGTADEPIIFTSIADEITHEDIHAGNFASPNMQNDANGLWGGLIVLGNAPISVANGTEAQIEGIPTTDVNGLYGGSDAADNSGSITYVSVRHGGANIGEGNEINGITFGGVGSETVVSNIEIVGNQDDGVEWFGGTVNASNVISWNAGDDGLDTDQGWSGTVDNFMVISSTGHCFELDGPEGADDAANVGHKFMNGTVLAATKADTAVVSGDLINVDYSEAGASKNTEVAFENVHFTNVQDGQEITSFGDTPEVTLTNVTLDVSDVADHVEDDTVTGVTTGTSGFATATGFSWTWATEASAY